ncbi:MAG TPA: hypothetical protein VND24_05175, partial [Steroidobacteraceae bacterium]|nr:hypothetical protein [Steroidobacteraceae bacterium]
TGSHRKCYRLGGEEHELDARQFAFRQPGFPSALRRPLDFGDVCCTFLGFAPLAAAVAGGLVLALLCMTRPRLRSIQRQRAAA